MDITYNIVDVGANSGEFGIELAARQPANSIYMIEPNGELADVLRAKIGDLGLSNAFVHEVAISDRDGEADLNTSTQADRGVSSLLMFDKTNITSDPYWATRGDLLHEAVARVKTLRLSTFLEKCGIDTIDFIKIDAQGLDLTIMASAGKYLNNIRAGMLEVPTTNSTKLYLQESQSLQEALNFLTDAGFTVIWIKPNDPACNEVNVYFSREPQSWQEHIDNLGLSGFPAFDGRHYWLLPSNTPNFDGSLSDLLNETIALRTMIETLESRNAALESRNTAVESRNAALESRIAVVES